MKEFGHIYLSWREGSGMERHIVGVIKKKSSGVTFEYLKDEFSKAVKNGFSVYTEFPDVNKLYTENVLETFGSRIIKSERSDIQDFYDFWEVDSAKKEDKLYMLAHTQGWNPTDNFEFLADYHPSESLKFITDLAGLSVLKIKADTVKVGDILSYEYDSKNQYDKYAVRVLKDGQLVGYIKKVHSRVFYKVSKKPIKVVVKAVEQNGVIKRVFVKVCEGLN